MWVQVVRCSCACTCTCTGGLLRPPKSCTRSKSASSSGPPEFPINRPPPTLACRFRFPLLSLSSSKPPGFPGHSHPPRTEAIITRASDRRHHHHHTPAAPCTLHFSHLAHHSTSPAPALSIHHQTTTLQPTRCSPHPDQLPKPPNHQNHHSNNGAPQEGRGEAAGPSRPSARAHRCSPAAAAATPAAQPGWNQPPRQSHRC